MSECLHVGGKTGIIYPTRLSWTRSSMEVIDGMFI